MFATRAPDLSCSGGITIKASKSKERRLRKARNTQRLWQAAVFQSGMQPFCAPYLIQQGWQPEPERWMGDSVHGLDYTDHKGSIKSVEQAVGALCGDRRYESRDENGASLVVLTREEEVRRGCTSNFQEIIEGLTVLSDSLQAHLYGEGIFADSPDHHVHQFGSPDVATDETCPGGDSKLHADQDAEVLPEAQYLVTAQCRIAALIDLHHRHFLSMQDLQAIVDGDDRREKIIVQPVPDDVLHEPPTIAASAAVDQYGQSVSCRSRYSTWVLSLDQMPALQVGGPVLADVHFGSDVPDRSRGVVVEMLEAHLARVLFAPHADGAFHCLNVPVERLCVPVDDVDDFSGDSQSDDSK